MNDLVANREFDEVVYFGRSGWFMMGERGVRLTKCADVVFEACCAESDWMTNFGQVG
jgi:hypothetical protein